MNRLKWQMALGVMLVATSVALYIVQIDIFHSSRDTFFYLFQDLAFIPIQVLLVTLILNQLLNVREKQAMLNKRNLAPADENHIAGDIRRAHTVLSWNG